MKDDGEDGVMKSVIDAPYVSQQLHRGLSPLMNFAFGFTEVGVLSSICVTLQQGLGTGGPVVFFWGFLINSIFTVFIGYSMAEVDQEYVVSDKYFKPFVHIIPISFRTLNLK